MKLRDAINTVRPMIGDKRIPYRYDDERLAGYGNDAIKLIGIARPELFRAVGEVTCVEGLPIQTFPATESNGIVDVLYIVGGPVVSKIDRFTLNRFKPNWMSDAPAPAKNWMPVDGDPNRFLVYPPSPAGQQLVCLYNAVPPTYSIDEDIELSDSYLPLISMYVVSMAEMANDPSVSSGRAAQFAQLFAAGIGKTGDSNFMGLVKEKLNDGL